MAIAPTARIHCGNCTHGSYSLWQLYPRLVFTMAIGPRLLFTVTIVSTAYIRSGNCIHGLYSLWQLYPRLVLISYPAYAFVEYYLPYIIDSQQSYVTVMLDNNKCDDNVLMIASCVLVILTHVVIVEYVQCHCWLPANVMYPANSTMRLFWLTRSTSILCSEVRSDIYVQRRCN